MLGSVVSPAAPPERAGSPSGAGVRPAAGPISSTAAGPNLALCGHAAVEPLELDATVGRADPEAHLVTLPARGRQQHHAQTPPRPVVSVVRGAEAEALLQVVEPGGVDAGREGQERGLEHQQLPEVEGVPVLA